MRRNCLKIISQKENPLPVFEEKDIAQPTIACSKLTIETLEQGVKYVQS